MKSCRGARKRSSAGNSLDKTILILVESHSGSMSVGMFKFDIHINKEDPAFPVVEVINPEGDTSTENNLIDLKPTEKEVIRPEGDNNTENDLIDLKPTEVVIRPEGDNNTVNNLINLKPTEKEEEEDDDDEEDEDKEEENKVEIKVDLELQHKATFYKQSRSQPIYTFASCRFPAMPEELYIFPDDSRSDFRNFITPCVFNLITNRKRDDLPRSAERKRRPISAAVGDYVYLLSTSSDKRFPGPMFESYDPAQKIWEPSPDPPFPIFGKRVRGYVVLKDKFIVVCLTAGCCAKGEATFFSYNTITGLWKPVKQLPCDTDAKIYPALFGEGAVLFDRDHVGSCDGFIYSYRSQFRQLLAFSYTEKTKKSKDSSFKKKKKSKDSSFEKNKKSKDSMDYDLTFGIASVVEGFNIKRIPSPYSSAYAPPPDYESGAIVEVDHNVFCLLHADRQFAAVPVMNISGLIIKIHDDDFASCTVLKEFTCGLAVGKDLRSAKVKSCLLLPEEQRGDRPWKRQQRVDHSWKHKQRVDHSWKHKQTDDRPLKHKRWT